MKYTFSRSVGGVHTDRLAFVNMLSVCGRGLWVIRGTNQASLINDIIILNN